jgi:hypothetical protein
MYLAVADKQGVPRAKLTGTIHVLKSDGTLLYDSGTLPAPGASTLDVTAVPLLASITSADLAGIRVQFYAASASGAATYNESIDYLQIAPVYYAPTRRQRREVRQAPVASSMSTWISSTRSPFRAGR